MTIFGDPKKPPQKKRSFIQVSTVRRFDGGWNVIDNELNLTPRHARIFDNVVRGPDGSVGVRYGYRLWADLHQGAESQVVLNGTVGPTAIATRRLPFTVVAHGLSSGDHIRFGTVTGTVGGIDLAKLSDQIYSVRKVDNNNFVITAPDTATSVASVAVNTTVTRDTHLAGGEGVNGTYYSNYIVVATEAGELIRISPDAGAERIWDQALAFALTDSPDFWGNSELVTFNVFGGKLLVWNGIDKPLEVDFQNAPTVQYLADPAGGGTNEFVPVAQYGATISEYVAAAGKTDKPTELSLSAHLIQGVWTGNTNPEDAVDVDMSKVSNSQDGVIMGIGEFRGKAVIAFRDVVTIGTLGKTTTISGTPPTTIHEPEFKDNVAQHGTVSHRTMVSLGNDYFMCDHVGVPSLAQASLTDQLVPDRVSELIEPAMQRNISRLSFETLRLKAFAVYNPRDHQYMLFMPDYDDDDVRELIDDPIILDPDIGTDRFILHVPSHNFEEGDIITVAGATDIGPNTAAQFNGTRTVISIPDIDRVILTGTGTYTGRFSGGGTVMTATPQSQQTNGYVLSYNPKLKVKAWSRYRGLNFQWGAKSVQGRMFFGWEGKIYEFGTPEDPIFADAVDDYDFAAWATNHAYAVGERVFDSNDGNIYQVLIAHTSPISGTFATARANSPETWEIYKGNPITFAWEWPWGDFDKRINIKSVRGVQLDAVGTGQFELQIFVDNIYKNPLTGAQTPQRSIKFTGADAPGFGAGTQPYGGGRRLREQPYWPIPISGKLHKFRFSGTVREQLRFVAVSFMYSEGSYNR